MHTFALVDYVHMDVGYFNAYYYKKSHSKGEKKNVCDSCDHRIKRERDVIGLRTRVLLKLHGIQQSTNAQNK